MHSLRWIGLLVIVVLWPCYCSGQSQGLGKADYHALMAFKESAASSLSSSKMLSSWSHRNPCKRKWYGVGCENGRVVRLVLEDMDLSGPVDALTSLEQLRVLSLKNNALNGTLPDLSTLRSLRLLFLSHNHFWGPLPSSIASLDRLVRLDVSQNMFSGPIPESMASLTSLLTLRLDQNNFSGSISELMLPTSLEEFNVSGNKLNGMIPASLSKFPASAFQNNEGLCGSPLQRCQSAVIGRNSSESGTDNRPHVATTPSSNVIPAANKSISNSHSKTTELSKADIVAIVVGDIAVLCLIACVLLCCCWRSKEHSKGLKKKAKAEPEAEYQAEREVERGSLHYSNQFSGCEEKCRLVFFEEGRPFELENLLRASAEMLGKGNFGSAYKAVMEDGSIVAVKRLKDVHGIGRREFEQHMDSMGKLRHPNLLHLKAYYYAKDEKLLVYDYMPNGSLSSLLHGCRGPGRTPLDWTTRMKIALEAAKGVAFIHSHCKSPKAGHGNIKSSNILLDKNGTAKVSDFGIAMMVSPAVAASRMAGYRAPEQAATKKISHKADVYSFGVLLLEILTGKIPSTCNEDEGIDLPRWVQSIVKEEWTSEVFDIELMRFKDIEEELVSMLQIAMLCVSQSPQQRPKMSHVVKMINDLRGEAAVAEDSSLIHSPSTHEQMPNSMSDSPAVSEDSGIRSL